MFFSTLRGRAPKISILCLAVLFSAGSAILTGRASAEETIHVVDAKARPTIPNAPSGVVYLTIENGGSKDDALTSVVASVADSASVHQTENDNGIVSMKAVRSLPVAAGQTVQLAPNGLHIMLIGLKRQLKTGDSFPITLNFAAAGPVTTTVEVGPIKAAGHDTNAMPGMKM
jgi:copper(I)-binding protein